MPVRINIDPNKVEAKIMGAWKAGVYPLSAQVLADCNRFVKIDQHTLEASSYTASRLSEGVLIWDTPYAKRQYWGIKTSLTPGRTWKWCETAKRKYKLDWEKIAQKLLRRNL